MLQHLRDELKDARKQSPRREESLRARNVILGCAVLIAPLTALMWIAILLLWDNVGDPPALMGDSALMYPVLSVGAVMLALSLHRRRAYFSAAGLAALPLIAVLTYMVSLVGWIFGSGG